MDSDGKGFKKWGWENFMIVISSLKIILCIKYLKYDSLYGLNVIENVNILLFVLLFFVMLCCYL